MIRLLPLALLASYSAPIATSRADAEAAEDLQAWLRDHVSAQHGEDRAARHVSAFADLNGDGRAEAFVYIFGPRNCGSGGCHRSILTRRGGSWQVVTQTSITWRPIRLLATRSNGWRDVGVFVAGGGILPGYEAVLSFDGRTYPENLSVEPARPALPGLQGEVLISSEDEGLPVFR